MTRITLVDIDQTVIRPLNGKKYPDANNHLNDMELINPDIFEPIGFTYIGMSNQGGIDAGHWTHCQVIERFRRVISLVPKLDVIYYCPDFNGTELVRVDADSSLVFKGSKFRKPEAGAVEVIECVENGRIIKMIGDRDDDEGLAINANIKFRRV